MADVDGVGVVDAAEGEGTDMVTGACDGVAPGGDGVVGVVVGVGVPVGVSSRRCSAPR